MPAGPPTEAALTQSSFAWDVNLDAQLMEGHSFSPVVGVRDPRFNDKNNPDNPSFFICKEKGCGKTDMILGVNLAEYALFWFCALMQKVLASTTKPIPSVSIASSCHGRRLKAAM